LGLGAGNHDSAVPMVVSAINPLANGVINPSNTEIPLTTFTNPNGQCSKAGVSPATRNIPPWMMAVIPTASRNKNKPIPGQPPGNVENNRCSSYLPTQRNSYRYKTNPQRSESFSNPFVVSGRASIKVQRVDEEPTQVICTMTDCTSGVSAY